MPILSGVSGNALASLSSIDQWINTLNATVGGAAKTGFKSSDVTFGGGSTTVDKLAANGALGIQFAEQALNVASTSTDFSQGQIVASTEFTHVAISGSDNAFFVLSDSTNLTIAATSPGAAHYYVTRDGEFHQDANGNLVNEDGLFLVGGQQTNATGSAAPNIVSEIVNLNGAPDPSIEMSNREDNANLGANVQNDHKITHTFVTDLQSLKFSKYGSSVYEMANPLALPALSDSAGTNSANVAQSTLVKMNGSSLEASNVDLPSSLVELSLAQKIYSALTKVISVDQAKIDSILNLIR